MRVTLITAFAVLFAWSGLASAQELVVRPFPETPLIEQSSLGQALNFDLRVENKSAIRLELRSITLTVRDSRGVISSIYEINDNGISPGIHIIPQRSLEPEGRLTIYNPYHSFPRGVLLGRLDYRLVFAQENGPDVAADFSVAPHSYVTRTRLRLPLNGRVLVWDGHDFYSHHRRFDLDHPVVREIGLAANASRYSYDLVLVDQQGRRFRTDGASNADHYSYDAPVVAPGDGTVVATHNDAPEGANGFSMAAVRDNSLVIFGNYVVIDHGNGEFSHIGHLRPGSVSVRVGQRVRMGDEIGRAGASGSSLFPHVHYELSRGIDLNSEGLPSTFVGLDRLTGGTRRPLRAISPDSGDLVANHGAPLN
jgi:murein DD-endopeptidase MepM/ murein hydrolase activator NlpD